MSTMNMEALERFLSTPQDALTMCDERLASTLTLSFIGMCARPKNLCPKLLEACIEAFNNNRGKTEKEEAAVYNAIIKFKSP